MRNARRAVHRMTPRLPWQPFLAELVGTAALVLVGLSVVILTFGAGSPVARLLPDPGARRAVAGFLFGATGAGIALSPVGKESGAHLNPAVTLAFWLAERIHGGVAVGYVLAQLAGATLGALPLLAWGDMGRSVAFGATLPGPGHSPASALLGEAITTFAMITSLCWFLGSRRLRRFTPALFPLLYAAMVYLEAPVSGTSTNPARSLGPAVVSGRWQGWWVYWVGPLLGTLAAALLSGGLARGIEVAKLYHFAHDRHGLFRRMGRPAS